MAGRGKPAYLLSHFTPDLCGNLVTVKDVCHRRSHGGKKVS
jgi:hypothetical protein